MQICASVIYIYFHDAGAFVIDCGSSLKKYEHLSDWLKSRLGISRKQLTALSQLLPSRVGDTHKPVVIVLDHFDAANQLELKSFFHTLATDCVKHKNYIVLVTVNDNYRLYQEILSANDGEKILSVFYKDSDRPSWSREMLSAMFDEQV